MKEYLEALVNRDLTIKAMKTIFWLLPISIITNNIFIHYKGQYDVYWTLINKTTLSNALFTITIFCIVGLTAWFFEKSILPFILISNKNKLKKEQFIKSKVGSNIILKRVFGFNPFNYINQVPKFEFFVELMYPPCIFILWLLAFNSILSYIAIFILFF